LSYFLDFRVRAVLSALICALFCFPAVAAESPAIRFPDDPRAVLDVRRDHGAKGDGVADDTDAIQAAIEAVRGAEHGRILYFPAGTYRITRPLIFKPPGDGPVGSMVGPWIYGEHRDRTILRLADDAEGFGDPENPLEMIRAVPRPDGAKMNADFFNRTLVNFTIDTGNHPGAVGIKYYSNNTGTMRHIRVTGKGVCGIDLGFVDQNGPHLIEDVVVEGFATGISTRHLVNSQTLSNVVIRAREIGLRHEKQVLIAENLDITAPLPIRSEDGVLTLLQGRLRSPKEGMHGVGPAINLIKGHLFAADVSTEGFDGALHAPDAPLGSVAASTIDRYSSHPVQRLGRDTKAAPIELPVPRPPDVPFPASLEAWVSVADFGAKAGDKEDDTAAFQRAFDAAAERGASVVYIPSGQRGDPNWYLLSGPIRVHGSVNRVFGFGMVRLIRNGDMPGQYPENLPSFVVDTDPLAPPAIIFEGMQPFSSSPSFAIEVRCPKRTVIKRSAGGVLIVRRGCTAFLQDSVGTTWQEPGSKVFARQYNTEGSRMHPVNTVNNGGLLRIIGMKTEATTTKIATAKGGRTEVFGVLNYNNEGVKRDQDVPFFLVDGGSLLVAGYREVHFGGNWWRVPVRVVDGREKLEHPPAKWQTWSLLEAGR
jgi:hypothetical protein